MYNALLPNRLAILVDTAGMSFRGLIDVIEMPNSRLMIQIAQRQPDFCTGEVA